jgi:hypothetical protein
LSVGAGLIVVQVADFLLRDPHRLAERAHRVRQLRHDPAGRIFQTARGGILQDSGYNEVWDEARREALIPAQYRSPLGRRPYDLRHAAVSLWLNSGVPATEVARHAGHGVAVLFEIYAYCIDGQATAANQSIAEALGTRGTPRTTPVTKATTTSSVHPEMAGQAGNPGGSGWHDRSQRPVRGLLRPVRGLVRGRPWPVHRRSADRSDPETRRPRTHSGRRPFRIPSRTT